MIYNSSTISSLPSVILFDWDNTIVHSSSVMHNAMNDTLRHFGYPLWDFAKSKKLMVITGKDLMDQHIAPFADEALVFFRKRIADYRIENGIPVIEGVLDFIKFLKSNNVKMGVVSNKCRNMLRTEIAKVGMTDYFVSIVGSGDARYDKPLPDPVFLALSNIQHNKDIWLIGDSITDIECALLSGCHPVLYNENTESIPVGLPLKIHFDDYRDLLNLMQNIS